MPAPKLSRAIAKWNHLRSARGRQLPGATVLGIRVLGVRLRTGGCGWPAPLPKTTEKIPYSCGACTTTPQQLPHSHNCGLRCCYGSATSSKGCVSKAEIRWYVHLQHQQHQHILYRRARGNCKHASRTYSLLGQPRCTSSCLNTVYQPSPNKACTANAIRIIRLEVQCCKLSSRVGVGIGG